MTGARRTVRATPSFFEDLDRQLPSEWGIPISTGMLVPRFTVVGQLASDGAVELIQLDLDLGPSG